MQLTVFITDITATQACRENSGRLYNIRE